MKRLFFFSLILFVGVLVSGAWVLYSSTGSPVQFLANVFFAERITPEDLRAQYHSHNLNILIVPGHDDETVGAQFGRVRETDLNVAVSQHLFELFDADPAFNAFVLREPDGSYADWFAGYRTTQRTAIERFRGNMQQIMRRAVVDGEFTPVSFVDHNYADTDTSLTLYGVNKWANENNTDIVLHVHFNDYPRRNTRVPGKYSGFSLYVPERQLPNARTSTEIAQHIAARLEQFLPPSNLPNERDTIIEDQDLIAIGSHASRDGASVLIEYGYIYETALRDKSTRDALFPLLAHETYTGLVSYLDPRHTEPTAFPLRIVSNTLKPDDRGADVLSLQLALLQDGVYPPEGTTLHACPLSGYYGRCTQRAVRDFQEKHVREILAPLQLTAGTGLAGASTITFLNTTP